MKIFSFLLNVHESHRGIEMEWCRETGNNPRVLEWIKSAVTSDIGWYVKRNAYCYNILQITSTKRQKRTLLPEAC